MENLNMLGTPVVIRIVEDDMEDVIHTTSMFLQTNKLFGWGNNQGWTVDELNIANSVMAAFDNNSHKLEEYYKIAPDLFYQGNLLLLVSDDVDAAIADNLCFEYEGKQRDARAVSLFNECETFMQMSFEDFIDSMAAVCSKMWNKEQVRTVFTTIYAQKLSSYGSEGNAMKFAKDDFVYQAVNSLIEVEFGVGSFAILPFGKKIAEGWNYHLAVVPAEAGALDVQRIIWAKERAKRQIAMAEDFLYRYG